MLDLYTGWKHPDHWDPPRPGAEAFLAGLAERGFDVVVFTTRHPVQVRRWLRQHGLLRLVAAVTRRKPPAHVFVDDRGVARARPVETGLSDERRVQILAGLDPTEKLIVGPFRALDELKDGSPVTPMKTPADGRPPPPG